VRRTTAWPGFRLTVSSGPSLNAYNDLHPLFENTPNPAPRSQNLLPLECLLLIDSGFSHTTITPLYNGRPLQRAVRRIDIGGKHLTNLLKELFSLRHFNVTQDFKIVNDMKEDISFVSQDSSRDMEKTWKGNKGRRKALTTEKDAMDIDSSPSNENLILDYVLPDGIHLLRGFSRPHDPSTSNPKKRKLQAMVATPPNAVNEIVATLGSERFAVPEILFSPSDIGSTQPGLADCVMQSLSVLPPLVQATMLANTLVVGGNGRIPGLVERLQAELRARVKTEWVVRVRKMDDPVTSTWLGGVRMASGDRSLVRDYAITRAEYLENGSTWVARKFAGLSK
jgi:actin-related protein 6